MPSTAAAKKPVTPDWHWSDLKAALEKRGWSLQQIALEEGYSHGSVLGEAARRPYPAVERVLASYAGIDHPMEIWPSRYNADGTPNRRRGPKPRIGQRPEKATTRARRSRKAAQA
jgi:Ner family transcriptional regulator